MRSFHIGEMFHDAARRHPSAPVTLDVPLRLAPEEGTEHTVAGLAGKVDGLVEALHAAGVRPGHRVAIHKAHNFDIVLLACAAARLGALPALLAPPLSGEVVGQLLRRLDRPWLVTDHAAPDVPLRGVLDPRPVQGAAARPAVRLAPRSPCLITHSSGTTGVPKLAVHCPNSLWNRLVPQKVLAWPIRRREPAVLCMTFVHSRFYHALGVFLHYGNPLVIAADHRPESVGPLLTRTRPGYVETHPNTYIEWERLAGDPDAPLSSIRVFGGTFDAIHPRTIRGLLAASRRRRPLFVQLYGQSETGPLTVRYHTRRSAEQLDARQVGRAFPAFTRVRAVDAAGRPVRRGETGHLEARSRGRILGYLGEDDRYAGQLHGGWWRLGDLGALDRWGRLYLLDREVDRIDAVPSNLRAEDLLMSRLPELREVAVVEGVTGEPLPVVCTVDDRPLDRRRWHEAAVDLNPLGEPLQLPFDAVPRTSTWKVCRSDLVHQLRQGG